MIYNCCNCKSVTTGYFTGDTPMEHQSFQTFQNILRSIFLICIKKLKCLNIIWICFIPRKITLLVFFKQNIVHFSEHSKNLQDPHVKMYFETSLNFWQLWKISGFFDVFSGYYWTGSFANFFLIPQTFLEFEHNYFC